MFPDPQATAIGGPFGSFWWFIKPFGDGASSIWGVLVVVLRLRRVPASVMDGGVGRALLQTLRTWVDFLFLPGVCLQFVWLYGSFWTVFPGFVRLYCICLRLNIRISLQKKFMFISVDESRDLVRPSNWIKYVDWTENKPLAVHFHLNESGTSSTSCTCWIASQSSVNCMTASGERECLRCLIQRLSKIASLMDKLLLVQCLNNSGQISLNGRGRSHGVCQKLVNSPLPI